VLRLVHRAARARMWWLGTLSGCASASRPKASASARDSDRGRAKGSAKDSAKGSARGGPGRRTKGHGCRGM